MNGQNLAEDVGGALLTLAFSHSGEDGLVSVFWWQVGWAFVVFLVNLIKTPLSLTEADRPRRLLKLENLVLLDSV